MLSKDVRLPVQLQRAMAAEAEAAREARAKVININIITITYLFISRIIIMKNHHDHHFCQSEQI